MSRKRKKRATFIGLVGDSYETLLGLLVPAEQSGVEFTDIMNTLDEYYSLKPNIIVERFKFYDCVKSETETMRQYLARLKCLARTYLRTYPFHPNVGHKATMSFLHRKLHPLSEISVVMVLLHLHVVFGRPLLRFPVGVHLRASFGI